MESFGLAMPCAALAAVFVCVVGFVWSLIIRYMGGMIGFSFLTVLAAGGLVLSSFSVLGPDYLPAVIVGALFVFLLLLILAAAVWLHWEDMR